MVPVCKYCKTNYKSVQQIKYKSVLKTNSKCAKLKCAKLYYCNFVWTKCIYPELHKFEKCTKWTNSDSVKNKTNSKSVQN